MLGKFPQLKANEGTPSGHRAPSAVDHPIPPLPVLPVNLQPGAGTEENATKSPRGRAGSEPLSSLKQPWRFAPVTVPSESYRGVWQGRWEEEFHGVARRHFTTATVKKGTDG